MALFNANLIIKELRKARGLTQIEKMEQDERFSKGLGYQILIGYKGILYSQHTYMDAELAFKYTMEYIRLLRPDFEIEKIPEYFLSDNDIKAIGRLATVYNSSGDKEKAIAIRYMLLENFERNYRVDTETSLRDTYIYTISNIARALVEEVGRYEEGLQMAEKGMEMLKGSENVKAYIRLLYHKAYALIFLDRKLEGEEAFKRCLMFSYALGDSAPLDMTIEYHKKFFKEIFGYELEVSILL